MTPADERLSGDVTAAAQSGPRPAPSKPPAAQIELTYHASAQPPGDVLARRNQFLRSRLPTLMRCAAVLCALLVLTALTSVHLIGRLLLPTVAVAVAIAAGRYWSRAHRARTTVTERLAEYDPSRGAWTSKAGVFLGPFDERAGLTGSSDFGTPATRRGGWVAGHLVLTRDGIGLVTPDGHRPSLSCFFEDVRSVELFAAAGQRTLARPFWAAWKAGRVVLTDVDGHTATITGVATRPIVDLLVTLGATVRQR